MKSKLFLIPFLAVMFFSINVNAQNDEKAEKEARDIVNDNYHIQMKSIEATRKKAMDALNDQKNLTLARKEAQRQQINSTYQQQKKANQIAFRT